MVLSRGEMETSSPQPLLAAGQPPFCQIHQKDITIIAPNTTSYQFQLLLRVGVTVTFTTTVTLSFMFTVQVPSPLRLRISTRDYLEASLVGVLFHAALVPAGRVPRERLLPELAALLGSSHHPLVLSLA